MTWGDAETVSITVAIATVVARGLFYLFGLWRLNREDITLSLTETIDADLDELSDKLDDLIETQQALITETAAAWEPITTTGPIMPEYSFQTIVMPLGTNGEAEMHYQVRVPPSQKAREAAGIFQGAVTGSIEDRPVLESDMRHTLCSKCGALKLLSHVQFPTGICETCKGGMESDPVYATVKPTVLVNGPDGVFVPGDLDGEFLDATTFKDKTNTYVYGAAPKKGGSFYITPATISWPSVKPKLKRKPAPPPEPVFERLDRTKRKIDLDD